MTKYKGDMLGEYLFFKTTSTDFSVVHRTMLCSIVYDVWYQFSKDRKGLEKN